jgi:hypothetical protein
MSEMTSILQEIQTQYLSGAFENEEQYHNAMTEAQSYYFEKL